MDQPETSRITIRKVLVRDWARMKLYAVEQRISLGQALSRALDALLGK